ncbi:MAG: TlpA family protein disulfide reductase [Dehalococcoidia bacterium]|nr:MAG: TlpA family protein disulfide reductase [Dehalococcoidia bacterium]
MASLFPFARLDSMSPARRTWLRRAVAGVILVAALAAFVSEERAARNVTNEEQLGILGGAASPTAGQAAPDFVLREYATGRLVKLSDYRGKVVVLNFWATWCPPCIAEMPALQELQASHEATGDLVVIAVDVQEPPSVTGEFAQQRGLTMPILSDRSGSVAKHYGLPGLPGTFFIDRDGVVRSKVLGPVLGKPLVEGLASAGGR